jgi:excisionase family DNA binding protein
MAKTLPPGYDAVLTSAEVAKVFGVDAKTVTRWERRGLVKAFRTPGGHRRYRDHDVRALLASMEDDTSAS